jgi:hypothetical protein
MKILNIALSMTLFVLLMTSMTLADGPPLKVNALLDKVVFPKSMYSALSVVNVSNTNQEFYTWGEAASLNFITDNSSIKISEGDVPNSPFAIEGLKKVTLKPSERYDFMSEGGFRLEQNGKELFTKPCDNQTKSIAFRVGFVYLNQVGKRDMAKQAIWSSPLNVCVS